MINSNKQCTVTVLGERVCENERIPGKAVCKEHLYINNKKIKVVGTPFSYNDKYNFLKGN